MLNLLTRLLRILAAQRGRALCIVQRESWLAQVKLSSCKREVCITPSRGAFDTPLSGLDGLKIAIQMDQHLWGREGAW